MSILPAAAERDDQWPAVPRDLLPAQWRQRIMRDVFGCWIYLGRLDPDGYPNAKVNGHMWRVHRYVYTLLAGEIPNGLPLDHLCRIRNCVNPAHLEPVTNAENVRRGRNGELLTYCFRGHRYTEENTGRIKSGKRAGKRYCLTCQKLYWGYKPREKQNV